MGETGDNSLADAHAVAHRQRTLEIYGTSFGQAGEVRPAERFLAGFKGQLAPLFLYHGQAAAIDCDAVAHGGVLRHGGQLHRYLRAMADLPCALKAFHRPGPLPLRPQELTDAIVQCSEETGS